MQIKTILTIFALIILFATMPAEGKAHIISRKQCKQYAAIHSIVVSPMQTERQTRRRALRKCVRAAHQHLLTHGLPLPPLLVAIRSCESGGGVYGSYNYRAENPSSTASGAFQFLDTTWNHHRGYARAMLAPRRIQDRKALLAFGESGSTPWVSSKPCWSAFV